MVNPFHQILCRKIYFEFINTNTALVIVQYPDFFGRIFDLESLTDTIQNLEAFLRYRPILLLWD